MFKIILVIGTKKCWRARLTYYNTARCGRRSFWCVDGLAGAFDSQIPLLVSGGDLPAGSVPSAGH